MLIAKYLGMGGGRKSGYQKYSPLAQGFLGSLFAKKELKKGSRSQKIEGNEWSGPPTIGNIFLEVEGE
jgi:hypothetical protein